jgi:hypothetical protein
VKQVTDPERIRSVFCHPAIWPHVGDDNSPAPQDWIPPVVDGVVFLMPDDDSACFMLHAHTSAHWEVHSAVLPEHRGNSVVLVLSGLDWMRENTKAQVISTYVPRGNFAAAALAKYSGFQRIGVVPKSIVRNGMPVDQTLYAMELHKCP